LQRIESTQWKERHVSDALPREIIYEQVIVSVSKVVEILHASDIRQCLCLGQLLGRDVA
jgi:hypothetical protein